MLCEECHQNPATVVITVLSENGSTTRHLCKACMEKMESSIAQGDMSSFLSALLNLLAQTPKEDSVHCDVCGLSYEEFQNTGKLGCAHCYEVFAEQLKPLLQRVHGRTQHAGHVPPNREEENRLQHCILELKSRMDHAVQDENFEEAATLRDQIRALTAPQSTEVKPQ